MTGQFLIVHRSRNLVLEIACWMMGEKMWKKNSKKRWRRKEPVLPCHAEKGHRSGDHVCVLPLISWTTCNKHTTHKRILSDWWLVLSTNQAAFYPKEIFFSFPLHTHHELLKKREEKNTCGNSCNKGCRLTWLGGCPNHQNVGWERHFHPKA